MSWRNSVFLSKFKDHLQHFAIQQDFFSKILYGYGNVEIIDPLLLHFQTSNNFDSQRHPNFFVDSSLTNLKSLSFCWHLPGFCPFFKQNKCANLNLQLEVLQNCSILFIVLSEDWGCQNAALFQLDPLFFM